MVFTGKYFALHRHKNSWRAENSVCNLLSFLTPFQNITRENVCLTFGHLVLLCIRQQARARQSNAVVGQCRFLIMCVFCLLIHNFF